MGIETMHIDRGSARHGCPDIVYLVCRTIDREGAYEFGFLRRRVFEILGHYSFNVHNDTWMASVMGMLNSAFVVPINVAHHSGLMQDDVRKGSVEVYKTSGHHLNSVPMVRAKCDDVLRLADYVEDWQHQQRGEE